MPVSRSTMRLVLQVLKLQARLSSCYRSCCSWGQCCWGKAHRNGKKWRQTRRRKSLLPPPAPRSPSNAPYRHSLPRSHRESRNLVCRVPAPVGQSWAQKDRFGARPTLKWRGLDRGTNTRIWGRLGAILEAACYSCLSHYDPGESCIDFFKSSR